MKTIIAMAAVVLVSAVASAGPSQGSQDDPSRGGPYRTVRAGEFSCQELQSILRAERSLVITSGRHGWGTLYHADSNLCETWKTSRPAYVRSQTGFCFVGYVCQDESGGN